MGIRGGACWWCQNDALSWLSKSWSMDFLVIVCLLSIMVGQSFLKLSIILFQYVAD
jgi:hypothetical protein